MASYEELHLALDMDALDMEILLQNMEQSRNSTGELKDIFCTKTEETREKVSKVL
jgi:hypothetical protein